MNKATKKRTDIIPFGHGSTENNACCHCGKEVKVERFLVHVVGGGAAYVKGTEDVEDPNDAGDMGYFPVGTGCAARLKKAGVLICEVG